MCLNAYAFPWQLKMKIVTAHIGLYRKIHQISLSRIAKKNLSCVSNPLIDDAPTESHFL